MRVIDSAENLNELIQSLLLLTKLENRTNNMQILIRIDTVMDKTIERICKQHPDFKIYFSINLKEDHYNLLSLNTDPKLIEIVFVNLFRNAYLYSTNKTLHIELFEHANKLKIHFINDGTTLSASEQKLIFDPFYRGPNAHNNNGLGLGLRICERILTQFHYKIAYIIVDNKNCFEITF
jgi:K+-sensing histidine kinase KdpD